MVGNAAEVMNTVILASKDDLANDLVKTNSYMVGFKLENPQSLSFTSYEQEFSSLFGEVTDGRLTDPRIKDIRHIAVVDLRMMKPKNEEDHAFVPPGLLFNIEEKPSDALNTSISEVVFESQDAAAAVLSEWEKMGKIWFADPNYTSKLEDAAWTATQSAFDTAAKSSSGYGWHEKINTSAALGVMAGLGSTERPIIAVMDSGIDIEHQDIKDNIWVNEIALGEAGCSDDLHGCNTTAEKRGSLGNGDVFPTLTKGYGEVCPASNGKCDGNCCHGTHVAGIIAGKPNEKFSGVCPLCQIMAVKIVGSAQVGLDTEKVTILDSWIAAGLRYVAAFRKGSPVRIINTSFGKFGRSRAVAALVSTLVDTPKSKGTLIIGAAGNEDTLKIQYPAGYSDAIAVANLTSNNIKQARSNFGAWVDVAAPGTEIVSSVPGGDTEPKTGTSMAAPVVAGVAGLLLSRNSSRTVPELRASLLNTANPEIYTQGINTYYLMSIPGEPTSVPLLGSGIIDAVKAINDDATVGRPTVVTPERVKPGCGIIGGNRTTSLLSLFMALLPLGVAAWARKRKGAKT